MTWVDWSKMISIALTGVLGAIGMVADFKDKDTRRVTLWGRVVLAGIALSACLGLAVQWKDTSDAQKKRDQDAATTLHMATLSAVSLKNIERLLAPISQPAIRLTFSVSCNQSMFVEFCSAAYAHPDHPAAALKKWKSKIEQTMLPRLLFYKDAASVRMDKPALIFQFKTGQVAQSDVDPFAKPGQVLLTIEARSLDIIANDGTIRSFLDFPGHVVEMSVPFGDLKDLAVDNVTFIASSGERVSIPGSDMKVSNSPLATVYSYRFPNQRT